MSAYKIKLNFRNLEIRRIYAINEVSKKTVCLNIVSFQQLSS